VSELRHDVLTGRLVLLAPGRRARPDTHAPVHPTSGQTSGQTSRQTSGSEPSRPCPFCLGNEHETPPEVARIPPGPPDAPGWRVRVVPNLYPIVGGVDAGPGADGAHEVIVLSPEHDATFGDLADDQAIDVLTMMRERAQAHAAAGRAHSQLLINQGRAAGASIEHAHAQLLALEFVPPAVTVAVDRFAAQPSDPVLADQADAAAREQEVVAGGAVQAWCPTGAAAPFETRIAATDAGTRFEDATDGQVFGVALVLRDVLATLGRALDAPGQRVPYNVVVHNGPARDDVAYHWWIGIVARTAVVAGFEMGTAILVNTVDPRDAARALRGEPG
jgi:UDPglucose--hexose-1-phosphate uridylyltransferase